MDTKLLFHNKRGMKIKTIKTTKKIIISGLNLFNEKETSNFSP
jgi:hypothetical protein